MLIPIEYRNLTIIEKQIGKINRTMKNIPTYLLGLSLLGITLSSCEKELDISGLWVISKVEAGNEDMTPDARWIEFRSDGSQVSGNGWLQHSWGAWEYNATTGELSVVDSNGLKDRSGPFRVVDPTNDRMAWEREEEGMTVNVSLERADWLPATYGDQLIGLWQLEEAVGDGKYFTVPESGQPMGVLFFRWDRRFVIGTPEGRIHGVYNVHGHKPEVELIPYGDDWDRDFWSIEYGENSIALKLLNSDTEVTRTFVRIHEFPE